MVSAGAAESSPVRPPVQARSRRTLARILDASLTLLGERGRDGLTVQDIVSRAGTSVGSFYARFSGKEDLLRTWKRAFGPGPENDGTNNSPPGSDKMIY